jgi:uncharacterized membrane protein YadS
MNKFEISEFLCEYILMNIKYFLINKIKKKLKEQKKQQNKLINIIIPYFIINFIEFKNK